MTTLPAARPARTTLRPFDVGSLRATEFPWADETTYLNHAGIGPLPERVRRTSVEALGRRAAAHRLTDDDLGKVLTASRQLAARLIGADPSEIALASNTSYGISLAAQMLPLVTGDIVIASHGEFPANIFPWRHLEGRGIRLEIVPTTPEGWPDENRILDRMTDPRVKAVAISHVQFHTGYLADLKTLSDAARATATYLVVDAIQGIGQVPFDVRETPVDILSCGAQKWLLSPWGSGFTYVRKGLVETLEPPFAGWMAFEGTDDFSTLLDYPAGWHRDARKFELVTLAFQDFQGMNGSVGLLLDLSIEAIADHLHRINQPVVDWAMRRGIRLASPTGTHSSGMVCVAPQNPAAAFQALTTAGVVASLREGAIRLSPHCYNTIDEMAKVAELLDQAV